MTAKEHYSTSTAKQEPPSPYRALVETLNGKRPASIPFVTRLEAWYKSHQRSHTLPDRFKGMSLPEVHREVGVGQLKFMVPYGLRLRGVEVTVAFEKETCFHEFEPVVENFPGMWDFISTEKAGESETQLRTSRGSLRVRHELLQEGVQSGTDPYLKEHMIQSEEDLKIVEYILDKAEFVPLYHKIEQEQEALGDYAFVVPLLHRIPFQQALLEYLGEINLFYIHHDRPDFLRRLLYVLDQQMLMILDEIADFSWPYVEFPDNLHGLMTNPKLFREFCLPDYHRYTTLLHHQGKKVGSHTDGNVKPLLGLLQESGLDVCESFSPSPLTPCTFEEAWNAWRAGPLIWGGIPSPILEAATDEEEFDQFIERLLTTIGADPIILGVVDLFMYHNSIERVQKIARRVAKQSQISARVEAEISLDEGRQNVGLE